MALTVLRMQTISTRGGDLTLTVSWRKNAVSQDLVEGLCSTLERILRRLGSGKEVDEKVTVEGLLA